VGRLMMLDAPYRCVTTCVLFQYVSERSRYYDSKPFKHAANGCVGFTSPVSEANEWEYHEKGIETARISKAMTNSARLEISNDACRAWVAVTNLARTTDKPTREGSSIRCCCWNCQGGPGSILQSLDTLREASNPRGLLTSRYI
jgi:hypothetical protein